MASFNTTTYDVSDQSFNLLNPIYINAAPETTSAKYPRNPISISGINYYNGLFGNVMCSLAVDGGDSVLGGNVIIAGDLSCCARVAINGNASITGNLFAASDVSFQKRLFVGQDTSLNGKLYVKNDTSLNGNVTITGNIYLANLPTCSVTPSLTDQLVTKNYVDSNFVTTGAASTLTFNTSTDLSLNARLFIGYGKDASLNGNLFVLNKTINQGDVSINSRLFVALDCSVNGNLQIKGRTTLMDCSLNGKTTFITLPTSTVVPTTIYQLVNKTYVDSAVTGVNTGSLLGTSNTWTGTNTFNSSLPISTVVPTTIYQLVNKIYVDSAVTGVNTGSLLGTANTWTNTNTWSAQSTFNGNVKLPAKRIVAGDANNNMQIGDSLTFNNLSTPSGSQSYQNTAFGTNTLINVTTGYSNTAVASYSLYNTTTGNNNTGVGAGALYGCTTGSRNFGIGSSAGYQMTTGNDNVWVGNQAGFGGPNTRTGSQNVAIGANALDAVTTGTSNVAIGFQSGKLASASSYNTFIGAGASCFSQDVCSYSTAIGYNAKVSVSNQIVLGTAAETVVCRNILNVSGAVNALSTLGVTGTLTANGTINALGALTVTGTLTANSTLNAIGAVTVTGVLYPNGGLSVPSTINCTNTNTALNTVTIAGMTGNTTKFPLNIGDFQPSLNGGNNSLAMSGQLIMNGGQRQVWYYNWCQYAVNGGNMYFYYGGSPETSTGGAYITPGGIFTNGSDRKFKQNIVDLSYGLAEVLKLRPVQYQYIKCPDRTNYGFIAQEVVDILPDVVEHDTENDGLCLAYSEMISVLTKAIQEQNAMIVELQQTVKTMQSQLEELK